MIKVLSGVCGEGRGHISRSSVILEHMVNQGKNPYVVCSSDGVLGRDFNTTVVSGRKIVYSGHAVNKSATFLRDLLKTILTGFATTRRVLALTREYKPDIILTDYDPFVSIAGGRYKIPLISIDHQHVISNCELDFPFIAWSNDPLIDIIRTWLPARLVTNRGLAQHYFITSFFFPEIKEGCKENTTLVGPILRKDILNISTTEGNHLLLYATSPQLGRRVVDLAKWCGEECRAYGFGVGELRDGNITFTESSNGTFFQDLASCRAVITNGGYTLMSEALYLGKPVFALPPKGHYEQMLNSYYLRSLGYGSYSFEGAYKDLGEFTDMLPVFRRNIARDKDKLNGNEKLFSELDRKVEKLLMR